MLSIISIDETNNIIHLNIFFFEADLSNYFIYSAPFRFPELFTDPIVVLNFMPGLFDLAIAGSLEVIYNEAFSLLIPCLF